MMKPLLALVVLATTALSADAGPIRRLIDNRRGASVDACGSASAQATSACAPGTTVVAVATPPAVVFAPAPQAPLMATAVGDCGTTATTASACGTATTGRTRLLVRLRSR